MLLLQDVLLLHGLGVKLVIIPGTHVQKDQLLVERGAHPFFPFILANKNVCHILTVLMILLAMIVQDCGFKSGHTTTSVLVLYVRWAIDNFFYSVFGNACCFFELDIERLAIEM
jgi:hypothetical protein